MPQIINTNIPSLAAQNKLDRANEGLATSFKRLSSGLRINSAKDDAAGLAIAKRFSSTISGLEVAKRNANDAISLAQVAEGALEEVTTILQRARELALQSANGSNSAADRKALQSEVNQLKQELTRVATTTTFNGNNILDGNLQNAQFQIGAEANQTVSVSIQDTRTTAIGTNELATNNRDGIEQATHREFIGGGFAAGAQGLGAEIGLGQTAGAYGNGYLLETLTVSHVNDQGITMSSTVNVAADTDAATAAADLTAIAGVSATGFNQVTLSDISDVDTATFDVTLKFSGNGLDSDLTGLLSQDSYAYTDIATAINADTDLQAAKIYAVATDTQVTIYAMEGHDIVLEAAAAAGSIHVASAFNGGNEVDFDAAANSTHTRGGRVDVTLDQGYSLSTNGAGLFSDGGGAIAGTAVGQVDVTNGVVDNNRSTRNGVGAQTLSISGSTGSATVAVDQFDEASNIATKINAVTGTTNVKAKATTTVTLQDLSQNGTVNFTLFGTNTTGVAISAAVTTTDLTALAKKINEYAGNTGITAAVGDANGKIILTHSDGKNIGIQDFSHSASQVYADPSVEAVTGAGTSVATAATVTMQVRGNESTNIDTNGVYNGTATTLRAGGTAVMDGQDSTVIGGRLSFTSSAAFSASSTVNGVTNHNSLFSGAANSGNSSSALTVNTVDISTVAGANSAIAVLDDAMNQVSAVRADLGAVQSRFESTIRNLSNNIENLTVARSRILDTDFAAETAALAKNQILSQAGIAVLGQANALPQSVLSLLK